MKRRILMPLIALVLAFGLMVGLTSATAQAATEVEIEASITAGLTRLAAQQNADGSWGGYEQVAHTGFAVVKMEDRAFELGFDSPFDTAYEYSANVVAGLDYILRNAHTIGIGVQPAGDPDSNGNGIGVYLANTSRRTYPTGIALMAIAGSRDPARVVAASGAVNGWTYGQVVQDAVDYLAWGQVERAPWRGGWGYSENYGHSDNSVAGYAVLGLDFAESPAFGFSATVPAFVKSELNLWIDYIQNDVNGDANDGGSGYSSPNSWVNILKTGNLIYQMAFYGDSASTQRVIDAVDYIERTWNNPYVDPGFRPHHYQAMYCLMKGLERMGIDTIDIGAGPFDWFDEISSIIVTSQYADGSWPSDYWGDNILSAGWALLTLEKVTPPAEEDEGLMTGGGSVTIGKGKNAARYTHGFNIRCDASHGNFQYNNHTQKGKFHLESITSVSCSDDPTIEPAPPSASFDTLTMTGTGRWNGESGATIEVTLTDAGQPGRNDTLDVAVKDAGGNPVSSVSGNLSGGNHQAHDE